MSHATVLCILGADVDPLDDQAVQERVDELMAPYDENMECDPERVYDEDIIRYPCYSDAFVKVAGQPPKMPERGTYPDSEHDQVWADYDAKCRAYGEKVLEKLGGTKFAGHFKAENVGWDAKRSQLYRVSTYNPKSKWDWYVIGGRWTGFFLPKKGAKGVTGEPGSFGNQPDNGRLDVIRVGDIDLEGMALEAIAESQKSLADYDSLVAQGKVAEARMELSWSTNFDDPEWRSKMLAQATYSVCTFAWVNSQGWTERGQMGWFGMASNEEDEQTWGRKWVDALKKLDPRTTVAVVDYHI